MTEEPLDPTIDGHDKVVGVEMLYPKGKLCYHCATCGWSGYFDASISDAERIELLRAQAKGLHQQIADLKSQASLLRERLAQLPEDQ